MLEVNMQGLVEGYLIKGIGTNNGTYPSYDGKKLLKEYDAWQHMLRRCTEGFWVKRPTYTGTTCSENFKSYSYFYEWCQQQVGFKNKEDNGKIWSLDKDLLFKGNKIYSEDTCVFIPNSINVLLTKRDNFRGDCPVGVSWNKRDKRYGASCSNGNGVKISLGYYFEVQEAFQAYKTFKEALIKEVAEQYKAQIDERAYQALLNYQVEITD